jgi:hypothetical protein
VIYLYVNLLCYANRSDHTTLNKSLWWYWSADWELWRMLYNLKLSRRLNSVKSSRAHSRIIILMMGTDGSRNVGLFLQPIDASVCPRRFYWVENVVQLMSSYRIYTFLSFMAIIISLVGLPNQVGKNLHSGSVGTEQQCSNSFRFVSVSYYFNLMISNTVFCPINYSWTGASWVHKSPSLLIGYG